MLFIKLTDCMSFQNFSFGNYSFIIETFSWASKIICYRTDFNCLTSLCDWSRKITQSSSKVSGGWFDQSLREWHYVYCDAIRKWSTSNLINPFQRKTEICNLKICQQVWPIIICYHWLPRSPSSWMILTIPFYFFSRYSYIYCLSSS